MRFTLLVAVAFLLGVTAQPDPPPPSQEPAADPNTATGPAKTQTVEDYFKLHPNKQLQSACNMSCIVYQDAESKEKCCKELIERLASSLLVPKPNFQWTNNVYKVVVTLVQFVIVHNAFYEILFEEY